MPRAGWITVGCHGGRAESLVMSVATPSGLPTGSIATEQADHEENLTLNDPTSQTDSNAQWEQRLADLWASMDSHSEEEFLARMDRLAAELPADNAVAVFERAGSFDSTGHSDLAVPLYRQALELGLHGERRRRAVIQMASSLRNLGRAPESVALLTAERDAGSDHLDDAITATLALALVDTGREREAVSIALTALARHLPRYQRSMANYARMILEPAAEE
jgi:hypothetical protein